MAKDTIINTWANTESQETGDLVATRFTDAISYGDEVKEELADFMAQLEEIAYTPLEFSFDPNYPTDPSTVDMSGVPSQPEAPEFDDIPDSADVDIESMEDLPAVNLLGTPEYSGDEINFSDPDRPDGFTGAVPGSPSLDDLSVPSDPDLISVTPPTLDDLTVPAMPDVDIPVFNGTPPDSELTEPELNFTFLESDNVYESCIATNLPAKICAVLTGEDALVLDSDITDDIVQSVVEQVDIEAAKSYDDVLNSWALKGHSLPQGAMIGRLDELRETADRNKAMAVRDVGVKQSELAIDAMKHAMSIGAQYEGILLENFNQIQTRAFEAAKVGQESALKLFDAQVVIYNSGVDLYKAEADVFRTLMQGNIAVYDGYRAQIEGVKAQADVQESRVSIYTALLSTNEVTANIYESQIRGVVAKADIERLKIERFRAEIEAYSARVNAKTAEYSGYDSAVRAELAKAQVAETKVRGYTAQIEGISRRNTVEIQRLQAVTEQNKGIAITNQGQLDVFRTEVMAVSEKNNAEAQRYGVEMSGHQESIKVALANYEGVMRKYQADMALWDTKSQLAFEEAKEQVRISVQEYELSLRSAETGAKVYAQLAASAMNMVNASASVGFSGSNSNSSTGDRTKAFETFSHNETLSGELST